ncbi:hypothetical protein SAY86_016872 [Trapa natans]|uniref:Uncharacterized protein n=1 Tax=Trapa natans TaxID=22666 RepID=A0AAN7LJR2_TRANT|nr:hypothetical protein SAY86_016872 [Trapa natans]
MGGRRNDSRGSSSSTSASARPTSAVSTVRSINLGLATWDGRLLSGQAPAVQVGSMKLDNDYFGLIWHKPLPPLPLTYIYSTVD